MVVVETFPPPERELVVVVVASAPLVAANMIGAALLLLLLPFRLAPALFVLSLRCDTNTRARAERSRESVRTLVFLCHVDISLPQSLSLRPKNKCKNPRVERDMRERERVRKR